VTSGPQRQPRVNANYLTRLLKAVEVEQPELSVRAGSGAACPTCRIRSFTPTFQNGPALKLGQAASALGGSPCGISEHNLGDRTMAPMAAGDRRRLLQAKQGLRRIPCSACMAFSTPCMCQALGSRLPLPYPHLFRFEYATALSHNPPVIGRLTPLSPKLNMDDEQRQGYQGTLKAHYTTGANEEAPINIMQPTWTLSRRHQNPCHSRDCLPYMTSICSRLQALH
jgi:hypothetical protein